MGLPGGNPVPWEQDLGPSRGFRGWEEFIRQTDHHDANSHLNCAGVCCRVPVACLAREDGLAPPVLL